MPVQRYRTIEEMPALPPNRGGELAARIRVLWQRAFLLCPRSLRRGVRRYRSMDEANEDRARELLARVSERGATSVREGRT